MGRTIFYIVLYTVFNVSGAASIKWLLRGRMLLTFREWMQFLLSIPFVISFSLIILSALCLFKALTTNSFSLIIPIATGINFFLTVVVGYFLFNDRLSLASYMGFLLILSGILVLSINTQTHAQ